MVYIFSGYVFFSRNFSLFRALLDGKQSTIILRSVRVSSLFFSQKFHVSVRFLRLLLLLLLQSTIFNEDRKEEGRGLSGKFTVFFLLFFFS